MTQQETNNDNIIKQECYIDKIINSLKDLQKQLSEIPPSKKVDTVNNNGQPSEIIEEKRQSLWVWVRGIFKKNCRVKKEASNHDSGGSQDGSRRTKPNNDEDLKDADLVIRKLQSDIFQMINAFKNLTEFQTNMSKRLDLDIHPKKLGAILKKTDSIRSRFHDLKEIRRKVFTLKCEIPSLLHKQSSRGISIKDSQTAEENDEIQETGNDIYLPGLHVSEDFKNSPAFEEVVEIFHGLSFSEKLCLLSFAVFPENREVERTMLMYWWIGEGFINYDDSGGKNGKFLPDESKQQAENSVTRILKEFSTKRLLEQVEDERKLKPSSYRMEPHVHSAVICLAETVGLFKVYSKKGKLTMKKSSKKKVCLVKGSSLLQKAKASKMKPETLETVFNSSERYPDFTFKWFPLMNSLRVLYLGRWERTAKRHIEVESTEFLKNMKTLKKLRLASFQGISRIEKLENLTCALPELVILDLKACYNLELLPEDVDFPQLIYLDVSECYMLDHMPKGIAKLSKLQVLKGFVISESDNEKDCAVKHLVNLRKLSITVNKYDFTVENLMKSLVGLKHLESLKIAWGFRFHDKKGKADLEEENKQDKAEKSKSDVVEGKKKASPPRESSDMIEKKPDDESKVEKERDRDKGKADLDEGKKGNEVEATKSKSDNVAKGDEKTSPPQESKDTIHKKTGDKTKVGKDGDGDKGKADPKEGTKHDEVEAGISKSDKVVEGDEKTSPPQDSKDPIQNKTTDKTKVGKEGDGDKGKANPKEGTKHDEVEATKSKSDKVVEGDEKISPPQESKDTIHKKTGDKTKVGKDGDGDKGKADPKEGTKHDEVEAGISKSDKVVEGDEKTSPPQDSKDPIQNKTTDKTKVGKEGDGDKGKANPKEGTKHDEVEATKSKSDKVVEGDEKISPPQESKDTIHNKTGDKTKVGKEEDGDKGKADPKEGTKHDEVEATKSKSDKVVEGDEKTSPPQESKDTIHNKTGDKTKVEKEEDGDKGKADPKEGTKHDEVEAEISKSDNGVEGVKKPNPSPDDHKENSKVQEKGDGNKGNDDLDEGKKKNEVKAESPKPDKVIEGDGKRNPPQESKDTIQSKAHYHREITKVQEKREGVKNGDDLKKNDGGESKTQKSHKTIKCGKIWGRGRQENQAKDDTSKLPSSLKKLELESFPEKNPPKWLNPQDLDKLAKLSIKGGKLSRISDEPPTKEKQWPAVKTLRLKYLHEFKVEWKDLQALFPEMTLLEKYKCPNIAFCPTDGNGVWRKPHI